MTADTPEARTLGDCPFCGGKAAIVLGMKQTVRTVDVTCQDCGGTMPAFCEDDAISDWNTRASASREARTPGETCATCEGSGYSNHPDSGEICQTCKGSGAAPSARASSSHEALRTATPPDLVQRCKELLEWNKTGLLAGGSDGAVRALASELEVKIGKTYALTVAESQIKDDAMREVVRLATIRALSDTERQPSKASAHSRPNCQTPIEGK